MFKVESLTVNILKPKLILPFLQPEYSQNMKSCSCDVNNIMDILRNDSIKDMIRGPPGRPGLNGLTVS